MGFLSLSITISLSLLVVSCFLGVLRLVKGPSLPDRALAVDVLAMIVTGLIVISAVLSRQQEFFILAAVWVIFMFLGTVAFSRYLEKRE